MFTGLYKTDFNFQLSNTQECTPYKIRLQQSSLYKTTRLQAFFPVPTHIEDAMLSSGTLSVLAHHFTDADIEAAL